MSGIARTLLRLPTISTFGHLAKKMGYFHIKSFKRSSCARRSASADCIIDLAKRLAYAVDIHDVMAMVLTVVRTELEADGVSFILREGDTCRYADESAISPLWRGKQFPIDRCISGWVMLNRQAVAIQDVFSDPRVPADAYRPTFVQSLAMAPVRREAPLAALGAYWKAVQPVSQRALQTLQDIADVTAPALMSLGLRRDKHAEIERITNDVAGEVSNLLQPVVTLANLNLEASELPTSIREDFTDILNATRQCSAVVNVARDAARQTLLPIAVGRVVGRVATFAKLDLPSSIVLSERIDDWETQARVEDDKLSQILLDLLNDVSVALGGSGRIALTLTLSDAPVPCIRISICGVADVDSVCEHRMTSHEEVLKPSGKSGTRMVAVAVLRGWGGTIAFDSNAANEISMTIPVA